MSTFIAEHLLEILFGLISTVLVGYIKHLQTQKKKLEKMIEDERTEEIEESIEAHIEPIKREIEDLRKYIRDSEKINDSHLQLIIASYRFRLVQLCRVYLKQGYMTQEQYDQLIEFFKVYHGLGGNGQAEEYYNKTMQLEIRQNS